MSSPLTQQIILTVKFKSDDISDFQLQDFKTNLQTIHTFEVLDTYNRGDFNYISLEIFNNSGAPLHSHIENLLDNFTENVNTDSDNFRENVNTDSDTSFRYLLCIYSINEDNCQIKKSGGYRRVHINKKGVKIITNNASKNISI